MLYDIFRHPADRAYEYPVGFVNNSLIVGEHDGQQRLPKIDSYSTKFYLELAAQRLFPCIQEKAAR